MVLHKQLLWKQRVVASSWERLVSMRLMKMFITHTLRHSNNFLCMTVSVLCWWLFDGWMVNGRWSSTSLEVENIIWIKKLSDDCTTNVPFPPTSLISGRLWGRVGKEMSFFKIINSIREVICTYQKRKCLEFRLL